MQKAASQLFAENRILPLTLRAPGGQMHNVWTAAAHVGLAHN
jgi:hypothetical protein